jgi:hypothetical protein
MKLITPVFEALLKDYPLYSQEKEKDPMVIAKLFMTQGSATWYILEFDTTTKQAFGYVSGLCPGGDELGYISLEELEEYNKCHPFKVERDMYFRPARLSKFKGGEDG